MTIEDIFFDIMNPVLKLQILYALYSEQSMTLEDLKKHLPFDVKLTTVFVWELCNLSIIEKQIINFQTSYQLTKSGLNYLIVLKKFVDWMDIHQINGDYQS